MQINDPILDGSSIEQAIVINETSEVAGVSAEYMWLQENYPGYKLSTQFLSAHWRTFVTRVCTISLFSHPF